MDGWCSVSFKEWTIAAHDALPILRIQGEEQCVGYILGWPIYGSRFIDSTVIIKSLGRQDGHEEVEGMLDRLGGRFIAIVAGKESERVYLDACGSLAAVYRTDLQAVGGSASVLADEAIKKELTEDHARLVKSIGNKWYPAGLTGSTRIRRLLPNHYLNLRTMETVRYWPSCQIKRGDDIGKHASVCFRTIQDNISACLRDSSVNLGITAGRDSRMLLSAVPEDLKHKVLCFTFDYGRSKRLHWLDVHTGRILASKRGLQWRAIKVPENVSPEIVTEYLQRIGFSGGPGKARDFNVALGDSVNLQLGLLTGFGGEILRGYYWKDTDHEEKALCASELVERLTLEKTERNVAAMQEWLEATNGLDTFLLLDLLYLEHRTACWASPHFYGMAPFAFHIMAFSHRRIVEAAFGTSVESRRANLLAYHIVQQGAKEIRDLPFGTFLGSTGIIKRQMTSFLLRVGLMDK